ncbi:uncharacterized protein LOC128740276 [Sabethes cyaneus]|uniref:uncharacterized protein LOC128740276 n=1 Tax=Sabethes cyaneus TaxID=53552 RepID=UPI00237E9DC2|nr:uncharacterized protein LOC128740276 [Sabethes cyaneus]
MNVRSFSQRTKPLAPKIWTRDEILKFLDIFESTFHVSVSDPFDSESEMWECISQKLQSEGCKVSPQHCQSKWNLLYKTFTQAPNRQSVFYAKIKQIIEFSQQISDDQNQQFVPNETRTEKVDIKHEDLYSIERLSETNDHCTESAEKIDKQLESEESASPCIEITGEERAPAASTETISSTGSKEVKQYECSIRLSEDLENVLSNILNKLDAIHNEQTDFKERLITIEKRQSENMKLLLEIKKNMNMPNEAQ